MSSLEQRPALERVRPWRGNRPWAKPAGGQHGAKGQHGPDSCAAISWRRRPELQWAMAAPRRSAAEVVRSAKLAHTSPPALAAPQVRACSSREQTAQLEVHCHGQGVIATRCEYSLCRRGAPSRAPSAPGRGTEARRWAAAGWRRAPKLAGTCA